MHTPRGLNADVAPLIGWCLDHLGTLADEFYTELMLIEGYADVEVEPQEFKETAHEAIEVILRKAAGMPLGTHLGGVSEAIGRRRASQGVPLEVLLQGVRMAFRILWATMHDRANPSQRDALGHSVVGLWEAIEYHTVRVHAGYLHEIARMQQHKDAELTALLSDFLDHDKPTGALTLQVSRTLGLLPDDSFLVAAVSLNDVTEVRHRLDQTRAHVHSRHDSALILLPGTTGTDTLASCLVGVRTAVAPIAQGLTAVPEAWSIAHDLLIAVPRNAPHFQTLSDGWPYIVNMTLPQVTKSIGAGTVAGLSRVSPETRHQLITTVETYMRTGSLSRTSKLLYCHRNTVLKRLSRFKTLTGLDASIPWDGAAIRLALTTVHGD